MPLPPPLIVHADHPEAMVRALARRLAGERRRLADPFHRQIVMVPNPFAQRWLRLALAREMGVEMGLEFLFADEFLRRVFADAWPENDAPKPEPLPPEALRWMIAAALYTGKGADAKALDPAALAPFDAHIGWRGRPAPPPPEACATLWDWSARLAGHFIAYAQLDPGSPAPPWWRRWSGGRAAADMRQQGLLGAAVFASGGLRDRAAAALGRRWMTLPEQAGAFFALPGDDGRLGRVLGGASLYVVGCERISPFHQRVIGRLARALPVEVHRFDGTAPPKAPAKASAAFDLAAWHEPFRAATEGWRRAFSPPAAEIRADAPAGDSTGAAPTSARAPLDPETHRGQPATIPSPTRGEGEPRRDASLDINESADARPSPDDAPTRLDGIRRFLGFAEAAEGWLFDPDASAGSGACSNIQSEKSAGGEAENAADGPVDCSFQTWAAPSRRREVEAVAADLRAAFAADPTLSPAEVAVYVPDFAAYQADFAAVFGRENNGPPYAFFDANADEADELAAGLAVLARPADEAVARGDLLSLAENPLFRAAWRLSDDCPRDWDALCENLNVFREPPSQNEDGSIASANASGPLNASNAPAATGGPSPRSWSGAVMRLRLGALMESAVDRPRDAAAPLFLGLAPHADPGGDEADHAGLLAAAYEALAAVRRQNTGARSPRAWAARFDRLAENWLAPAAPGRDPSLAAAERALAQWRAEIHRAADWAEAAFAAAAPANAAFPQNGKGCAGANADDPAAIPYELVRAAWPGSSPRRPAHGGQLLVSGVAVLGLDVERISPARVAYVLGLAENTMGDGDESIPLEVAFDGELPRFGPSAWRRSAFRRVVLSTSRRLVLSRVARDLRTGEVFRPAACWRTLDNLSAPGSGDDDAGLADSVRRARPAGPDPLRLSADDPRRDAVDSDGPPGFALSIPVTPLEPAALAAALPSPSKTDSNPAVEGLRRAFAHGLAAARADDLAWRRRAARSSSVDADADADASASASASASAEENPSAENALAVSSPRGAEAPRRADSAAIAAPPTRAALRLNRLESLLKEPLAASIRHGLEARDDEGEQDPDDDRRAGREPLVVEAYTFSNLRRDLWQRIISDADHEARPDADGPAATAVTAASDVHGVGERYRFLLRGELRARASEGRLPPPPYDEPLVAAMEEFAVLDTDTLRSYFAMAAGAGWSARAGTAYGRIENYERAGRRRPPPVLSITSDSGSGRQVAVEGLLPAHWRYVDGSTGEVVGLMPWRAGSQKDKSGGARPPVDMIRPWLAICLAAACGGDGGEAPPTLWRLHLFDDDNKVAEWNVRPPAREAARDYLAGLAGDCAGPFRNEFLPYSWLSGVELAPSLAALEAGDGIDEFLEQAAHAALFERLCEEEEKSGDHGELTRLPESALFLRPKVPAKPLALIASRISPFWRAATPAEAAKDTQAGPAKTTKAAKAGKKAPSQAAAPSKGASANSKRK